MTRRLSNLLVATSLLVCVGATASWACAPAAPRARAFHVGAWCGSVGYDAGGVVAGYCRPPPAGGDAATPLQWDWAAAAPDDNVLAKAGFASGTVGVGRAVPVLSAMPVLGRLFVATTPARYVKVPWWSLLALTAASPAAAALSAFRRRRRGMAGICRRCGYNLRATPGRCPECGDVPAAPQTAVTAAAVAGTSHV